MPPATHRLFGPAETDPQGLGETTKRRAPPRVLAIHDGGRTHQAAASLSGLDLREIDGIVDG